MGTSFLHWDVQDRRPDPKRRSPSGSNDTSLDPPGPFLRELGRHRDVSNLGPDPGRRYVQGPIPPITSVSSLLSREIGDKIRDVSHLRLDLGICYVPEAIPPPASAPSPSPPEIGQRNQDVSNLRPDSERQGVPEAVPLPPETLQPILDETSRPLEKVRRRRRAATPPHGNQFVEIVTPPLNRLPPTPGKQVDLQDAKTPTTNEDILDIPVRFSPIETAVSSRVSASRKNTKRKAFRELFGEDKQCSSQDNCCKLGRTIKQRNK